MCFCFNQLQPLVSTISSHLSEIPLTPLSYYIPPLFLNPVYTPKSTAHPLTMAFTLSTVTLSICFVWLLFLIHYLPVHSLSSSWAARLLIKLYWTNHNLFSAITTHYGYGPPEASKKTSGNRCLNDFTGQMHFLMPTNKSLKTTE